MTRPRCACVVVASLIAAVVSCASPQSQHGDPPKCLCECHCDGKSSSLDSGASSALSSDAGRRSFFNPPPSDPDGGALRREAEQRERENQAGKAEIAALDREFNELALGGGEAPIHEARLRRDLAALAPKLQGTTVSSLECRQLGCRIQFQIAPGFTEQDGGLRLGPGSPLLARASAGARRFTTSDGGTQLVLYLRYVAGATTDAGASHR